MEIPPFFDGQNSTASRLQLPRWQVRQTLSIQGSWQYPCHKRFATNGAVKSVYVPQIISQIERSLFHFKIDEEKKQINQQADTAPHSVKRFDQPQGPESAKLLKTNLLTSLKHNIQKLKIIQNQILKELLRSSS